jgi:hypothetical protein
MPPTTRTILPTLLAVLLTAGAADGAEPSVCRSADADPIRWVSQPAPNARRILRVGAKHEFNLPSEAAKVARDGDIVEIDAGEYTDTAIWKQNDLWLRGVYGRPHLVAPAQPAQGKAIWVISGSNVVVENVEMSGARVPARNGAGIRAQGRGLTVRASCFHDNENGILTSNDPANWLVVEFSEFARNGFGDGKSHNIYVGRVSRFEMRFSYSHGARQGHLVKSRAATNLIEFNRLIDDIDGMASYELDLPSGGDSLVRGNVIVQGAASPNQTMVSYAAEKKELQPGHLTMAFNTLYSARRNPVFVVNRSPEPAVLVNNLYAGAAGTPVNGAAVESGNLLIVGNAAFADVATSNFVPLPTSPAVDAAKPAESGADDARPEFQPSGWLSGSRRPMAGPADVGALECCSRERIPPKAGP